MLQLISKFEYYRCWINIKNSTFKNVFAQIAAYYFWVVSGVLAILIMSFIRYRETKAPIEEGDKEGRERVLKVFYTFLILFIAPYFFPTLNRTLQYFCIHNTGLDMVHSISAPARGTLYFFGYVYHFLLVPKLNQISKKM